LTKQFGQAQSQRWQSKACGSAFWTLKMDWMPGGDWGFVKQVENGTITAPASLGLPAAEVVGKLANAEERRSASMMGAIQTHQSFWDNKAPGTRFEHWRYADGWHLGWVDARDFFRARSEGALPHGDNYDRAETKLGTHDGAAESKPVSNSVQGPTLIGSWSRDGGDRIGALDLWVLKRMKEERCADKDTCGLGWEWEQGFRTGVKDFYAVVGV
jgi:hypothetical protein